jgi:hypothetical protein
LRQAGQLVNRDEGTDRLRVLFPVMPVITTLSTSAVQAIGELQISGLGIDPPVTPNRRPGQLAAGDPIADGAGLHAAAPGVFGLGEKSRAHPFRFNTHARQSEANQAVAASRNSPRPALLIHRSPRFQIIEAGDRISHCEVAILKHSPRPRWQPAEASLAIGKYERSADLKASATAM